MIIPSNVSAIDGGPTAITATISSVGTTSIDALALVGTRLYVAGESSGSYFVKIIDTTTNTVSKTLANPGGKVAAMTYYEGASKVWLTCGLGTFRSISTSTEAYVDNNMVGDYYGYGIRTMGASLLMPDANTLVTSYNDNNYNSGVIRVNLASGFSWAGGPANDVRTYQAAVIDKVLFSATLSGSVMFSVFDYTNMGNYGTPASPSGDYCFALTKWGSRIFASGYNYAKVYVYTTSGTALGGGNTSTALENTINFTDVNSKYIVRSFTINNRIYVMAANNSTLIAIDAATQTPVRTISTSSIGGHVYSLVGNSTGTTLYAGSTSNGNIYVIQ